jgi:hypothetical protein
MLALMFDRRDFLKTTSLFLAIPPALRAAQEARFEVAVIGASTGGVAAALAALRQGLTVVLTEETDWIGGQLTSQGVPPDEHPWIETFGRTASYGRYREAVRQFYRDNYSLSASARAQLFFNPGGGSVSPLTHEPRVSWLVLEAMLSRYISTGRLTVLLNSRPTGVVMRSPGDIESVTVRTGDGKPLTLHAKQFLDATELGDLLPLSRTAFVTGFESKAMTNEPSAPAEAQPLNMQAFTWCFAMEHREGEDHTISRPENYAFWRDYIPAMKPAWPGKLLSWSMADPVSLKERRVTFKPSSDPTPKALNLWIYRRIAARENFEGSAASDVSLVNWPQNDYWLGNPFEPDQVEPSAAVKKHLKASRDLNLALLYWMQTEAPRPDGGSGWKGLRMKESVLGTSDGMAKAPYIRESRRIAAETTIVEQHVSTKARAAGELQGESYPDSIGIGSYRIDLHPSTGGDNYIDVSSLPFEIPLGALIPNGSKNLLAACKNIGSTHITNGCYRLHPVEWNIGESAGLAAAEAIRTQMTVSQIRAQATRLADLQKHMQEQGVQIKWPKLRAR